MTKYSDDFKAALITRLLPPNNANVAELAKETGVPENTLYAWRIKHQGKSGTPVTYAPTVAS